MTKCEDRKVKIIDSYPFFGGEEGMAEWIEGNEVRVTLKRNNKRQHLKSTEAWWFDINEVIFLNK